jgi:hypothetical protein
MKNKLTLCVLIVLIFAGCDNQTKSTPTSVVKESPTKEKTLTLEEERQKNMAIVNGAESSSSSAKNLPNFSLYCSTGDGPSIYRLASDGSDVYYASAFNEANLRATKKSTEVQVGEREIELKLKSGDDPTIYFMEIDRSSLKAEVKYFSSINIYPPDGYNRMILRCQTADDNNLINMLKNAYDSTQAEESEKKRQYDARPNKI